MPLEAIKYRRGKLEILDQLKLPRETIYFDINTVEDACRAIRDMNVRGAPAIAIVGSLALAVELTNNVENDVWSSQQLCAFITHSLDRLVVARPTAVNMANARAALTSVADAMLARGDAVPLIKQIVIEEAETLFANDRKHNYKMARLGAEHMLSRVGKARLRVLTHCNTGSLATAGYGTALGVIRYLHETGHLEHVYFTETRPYNQGARLTAYECQQDGLPATMICDSMVGWLFHAGGGIDAVVTGADHVALNGDTANKIGTYSVAVLAAHHKVPFYVALPTETVNRQLADGSGIVVEQRSPREMTHFNGIPVTPDGINCWNPAFDVTPAALITGGIITEKFVTEPSKLRQSLGISD